MYKDDIFFKLKNSIYNTPSVKSLLLLKDKNPDELKRINKLVADQFPDRNLIDERHFLNDFRESQRDSLMETLKKANSFSAKEISFKERIESLPKNATIREEFVKCGKDSCERCPHGPYYYAYWKDNVNGNSILKKKYLGTML